MSEYMQTDAAGVYQPYNEESVYTDPDWQDPDAASYVEDGTITPGDGGGGRHQNFFQAVVPFTTIAKGGGQATVRNNVPINFRGSNPFNGSVEGRIPAGAIFTGRDQNGNGIPDILEKQKRQGRIWF